MSPFLVITYYAVSFLRRKSINKANAINARPIAVNNTVPIPPVVGKSQPDLAFSTVTSLS